MLLQSKAREPFDFDIESLFNRLQEFPFNVLDFISATCALEYALVLDNEKRYRACTFNEAIEQIAFQTVHLKSGP